MTEQVEEKKIAHDGEFRGYWGAGEVIFFDGHEDFKMKFAGGVKGFRMPSKITVKNGKIAKVELS